MHHIYLTKSFVLGSNNLKESDKQLKLLTEDFGFIKVIAQGVRKEESKLRFSVQDFSLSEFALVSGRTGWRLTNAKMVFSISDEINNKNLLKMIARIFNLLERFMIAESDDQIFSIVSRFIDFIILNKNKILHVEQINSIESVFVASILEKLGYLDLDSQFKNLDECLNIEFINSVSETQIKKLNKVINQSIRESGL